MLWHRKKNKPLSTRTLDFFTMQAQPFRGYSRVCSVSSVSHVEPAAVYLLLGHDEEQLALWLCKEHARDIASAAGL